MHDEATDIALLQLWDVLWDAEKLQVVQDTLGNVSPARLIAFWSELESSGWLESHPVLSLGPNDRSRALPCFWHYDEIKVSRGSGGDTEVLAVSWSSAMASPYSDVVLTKFPFLQVEVHRITAGTLEAIVKHVIWVQEHLICGKRPDVCKHNPGATLPFCVFFAGNKFDLKARVQINFFN